MTGEGATREVKDNRKQKLEQIRRNFDVNRPDHVLGLWTMSDHLIMLRGNLRHYHQQVFITAQNRKFLRETIDYCGEMRNSLSFFLHFSCPHCPVRETSENLIVKYSYDVNIDVATLART